MADEQARFLKYRNYLIGMVVEILAIIAIMLVAFLIGFLLVRV